MTAPTRRAALAFLFGAAPAVALAAGRRSMPGGRILVDVSPLRRAGDNTDADYLEEHLPGYLAHYVGPGHDIRVRIDTVIYGTPGSSGGGNPDLALDQIEGVGWIDGREIPLLSSLQATVRLPDIGGYSARERQDLLAQSFAQWLPRQAGAWR